MSRCLVILMLLTWVSLSVSVSEQSYGRRLSRGDPKNVKPPTAHGYNLRVAPRRKSRFGEERDSDDDYYPSGSEDDSKLRKSHKKISPFEAETDDEADSPIDKNERKGLKFKKNEGRLKFKKNEDRFDMTTPLLEIDINDSAGYESQEADALDMLNTLLHQKKKEEVKRRRGYPLQKNRRVDGPPSTTSIDVFEYNVPRSWLDNSHPEDFPTILPKTSFIRFDPIAPADRLIKKSRRKTNEKSSIRNRNVDSSPLGQRFAEITHPLIALESPGLLHMGKTRIVVTSDNPTGSDGEEVLEEGRIAMPQEGNTH